MKGDSRRKGASLAAHYALYAGYHGTRTTNPLLPRLDTSLYATGVSHQF